MLGLFPAAYLAHDYRAALARHKRFRATGGGRTNLDELLYNDAVQHPTYTLLCLPLGHRGTESGKQRQGRERRREESQPDTFVHDQSTPRTRRAAKSNAYRPLASKKVLIEQTILVEQRS